MSSLSDLIIKIHSWYPAHCCSDQDCKPVPCDQLLEGVNGSVIYDGITFLKHQVYPSLDGLCHACVGLTNNTPFCVFIQQNF